MCRLHTELVHQVGVQFFGGGAGFVVTGRRREQGGYGLQVVRALVKKSPFGWGYG